MGLEPASFGFTALLGGVSALPALSIDVNLPGVPAIEQAFAAPNGRGALTLGLFLAGFAVAPLVGGPLADRPGRRPTLLAARLAPAGHRVGRRIRIATTFCSALCDGTGSGRTVFALVGPMIGRGREMVGFRVLKRVRHVAPEVVARFRELPVANVSDVMSRMVAAGPRLRPLHAGGVLAGPALTVRTRPGDNLMIHKALDLAEAGDVVVVDGGGDLTNALMGELMLSYAERKGLAGIVLNGAVRDYGWVRQSRFPLYAAGVTHRGPYKDGPGEINVRISLDGMVIEPGDLVLGDEDGLVSVPFDEVEAVHAAASKKHRAETEQMAAIQAGRSDRSWVDAALTRLGCAIEG